MRITSTSMFVTFQDGLNNALGEVQKYQTQLSSGRRINSYSDDPSGAVAALRSRSEESSWSTYATSANDAKSWLSDADGALQSMSGVLIQIHSLAIQANDGSLSSDARSAIGKQISSLRDELNDLANQKHLGRPLFGGFGDSAVNQDVSTTPPTWQFSGDSGQVLRQISPGVSVQANIDGKSLFGFDKGAGNDIFSTLDKTIADINNGDTAAITADQSAIDGAHQSVLAGLGTVGATTNRVDAALTEGTSATQTLTTQRSSVEDTDMAAAVLKLQESQNAYTAALGAVSRANLPSLADFLK